MATAPRCGFALSGFCLREKTVQYHSPCREDSVKAAAAIASAVADGDLTPIKAADPEGKRNGNYRPGAKSKETIQLLETHQIAEMTNRDS
jgi:hypothetical protein